MTRTFCVVSGGSGCNAIVGAFSGSRHTTFVIPISDDGGSSAEVQRVLGGPSVGDLRSRLVRLIPAGGPDSPLEAIKALLEHRLSDTASSKDVKAEWHAIVEGKHRLWKGIPTDRKECIRAFLVHVEGAILKKAQRGFNWKRASVGNLFIAGASMFLGSIPSAIFLFASITEIPLEQFSVLPVINTSSTATIAAELENGEVIVGQSEISHPSTSPVQAAARAPTPAPPPSRPLFPSPTPLRPFLSMPPAPTPSFPSRSATPSLFAGPILGDEDPPPLSEYGSDEDDKLVEALSRNVFFSKADGADEPLPARLRRVFYLNAYGTEIYPKANPAFLDSLATSSCLVYSCGSLYTSILPCLALRGIGQAIATSPTLKKKILLLNATHDRETPAYSALDFVEAIRATLSDYYADECVDRDFSAFLTHLIYVEEGDISVDVKSLDNLGITCVRARTASGSKEFDEKAVKDAFDTILGPDR